MDTDKLIERYVDLKDTARQAPQYWESIKELRDFEENFVVTTKRSISFIEELTDEQIDKMLRKIEKMILKDLKSMKNLREKHIPVTFER